MERTRREEQPSLILTSDWHLREDQPECRTDDFWKEQWKDVFFVTQLQEKYGCPVVHAGDLFHHWKTSPYLITTTIQLLPKRFYTVFGQHDLPQHSLDLAVKCGITSVEAGKALNILPEAHWGQTPKAGSLFMPESGRKIAVWHKLTYIGSPLWPGAKVPHALSFLKSYPDFDLIVTGDNHKSFTAEFEGRLLVNPGCLTQQKASEEDYQPCVYLWYEKTNTVTTVYLPSKNNTISREHIDRKKKHDTRINAFIERIQSDWEGSISFEDNLTRVIKENKVKKPVQDIIYKALEV